MSNTMSAARISEGLDDYSDELEDAVMPGLIVAIAAQQPAWMRQAAREIGEYDDFDWGYEEWKMEREWAKDEAEFDEAMTRMDDDGAPIHRDHWAWSWGLE